MKKIFSFLFAMLYLSIGFFAQAQQKTIKTAEIPLSSTDMVWVSNKPVVATNLNTNPTVNVVGNVYYITASAGQPWGLPDNLNAMNAVFGVGNYIATVFSAVVPATVFSPASAFVFMDGSYLGAGEFNTFLTANITQIENWVAAGGRLYLKSAPNVGGNISLGFGGTLLKLENFTLLSPNVTATLPGHTIFTGPFTPVATNYTGNFFAHAILSGGTFTNIMNGDAPGCVLGGQQWGGGYVMFGTGTMPYYQSPKPQSQNLLQNILHYVANISFCNLTLNCPANVVTSNTAGTCGKAVTYSLPTVTGNCTPCTSPTAIPNYTSLGEFGGHRYFRSNFSRTWNQAKTMAAALGAHLVTLSSEAESNHVKGNGQMAWIGLTDEAVEGTFVWVTGEPVTYTNWWPGDPNNNGGDEDYVLMNFYGSTKWVDEGTNYFHRFIIEFDCGGITQTAGLPSGSVFPVGVTTNSFSYTDGANNTATCSFNVTVNDTEPPTLTCPGNMIRPATSPAGAVVTYNSPVLTDNCYSCVIPNSLPNYTYIGEMNGHKYFRSNFSRTWPQANALATSLGGHLVTIGSAAENSLLAGPPAWIGFTDVAVEGNFVWVTGEPVTYTNWWPGEPNNNGGDEDYAFMNFYGSNLWVDYGTNYFYPFIVEFECNPTLTQTAGFPSGATFPIGFTTNTFTYSDAGGNPASCSFTVEVTPLPIPNPITQTDIEKTMEVRTYPNPSAGDFNLLVISESNDPITVRILDETGNIKKVLMANSITKTLKVGNDLPAGKYIAEVIQGTSIQTVKLVKLK